MLMFLVQGPHFENHCKRKFLVEILVVFRNTLKVHRYNHLETNSVTYNTMARNTIYENPNQLFLCLYDNSKSVKRGAADVVS